MPMKIYHGSSVEVPVPQIKVTGFYKDFGFGFYCTQLEKQARRWAVTKRTRHIVNVYEYRADESLRVKCFETMTEEWLDFIVACRKGISHDYDIVEGQSADVSIRGAVGEFMSGRSPSEACGVWGVVKFHADQ